MRPALRSRIILAAVLLLQACRDETAPLQPNTPEPELALDVTTGQALDFRQVSAGNGHTCGVTTDDRAYCWGDNSSGQLGNGTVVGSESCSISFCIPTPVAVQGGLRFRQISAGGFFTCGLTTDDRAYCWGGNAAGALGDGTTTRRSNPVPVAGGRRFRHLITGGGHTCAVNAFDRVFCWGFNGSGQLGDGTTSNRLTPVRVFGFQFTQVSVGSEHTCAVTTGDRVYCWGENEEGQLGDRTRTPRLRPVPVFGDLTFRHVSAHHGLDHTCALTPDDKAYCWGAGAPQLGDSSGFRRRLKPVPVLTDLRFSTVSMGYGHTCGLTSDGLAYCWGGNTQGELGAGAPPDFTSFAPVAVAGGLRFAQLSAGAGHACGVTTNNLAYCWGDNFEGKLGDGNSGIGVISMTPVPVAGPI